MRPLAFTVGCSLLLLGCGRSAPAPSRESGPAPAAGAPVVVATFTGEVDARAGTFTLRVDAPGAAGRRQWEQISESHGVVDTVGVANVGTPAHVAGGCGALDAFAGTVEVRSYYPRQVLHGLHAELLSVTPSGHEACNSSPNDRIASDVGGGMWSYGRLGPGEAQQVEWRFRLPDEAAFGFTGRIVATVGDDYAVGTSPFGVAFDGSSVWVTNAGSDDLTRLAAQDLTKIGPVFTGAEPRAFAFDGTNLWVATHFGGLAKVSTLGSVLASYSVPAYAQGMAYDGSRLWLTDEIAGRILAVNPQDGMAIDVVDTGAAPAGIVWDGASLWVANSGANTVSQVDPVGWQVLATVAVDATPTAIAVAGGQVFVTCQGAGKVDRIDPATGHVDLTFQVGTSPRGITYDGTNLWVANQGDHTVTKASTDGVVLGTYGVGTGPTDVLYANGEVWVANGGTSTVVELDPTWGSIVGTFDVGAGPVVLAHDGTNLWVAEPSNVMMLTTARVLGTYPATGHEPRGIAFDGAGTLWYVNAADRTVTAMATNGTPWCTAAVGMDPYDVRAAGPAAFVASSASGSVSLVEGAACTTVATYHPGGTTVGIAVGAPPDVWVTAQGPDVVHRLTPGGLLGSFSGGAAGAQTYGVALGGGSVWAPDYAHAALTRLGADDGALLGSYPVGVQPLMAAYDGTDVWVTNFGEGSVSRVHPDDGTVTTIPVGTPGASCPTGLTVGNGSVWVAVGCGAGELVQIDLATGVVVGSSATGAYPYAVLYDGVDLWVANNGASTVTRHGAVDGTQQASYAVGMWPAALAFDGSRIWVANQGSASLSVLQQSDGSLVATYGLPGAPVGLAFDGASLWVTFLNGTGVHQVRPGDGLMFGGGPTAGGCASGLAYQGGKLWVSDGCTGVISEMGVQDGGVVRGTYPVGAAPLFPAFDGARVWVPSSGDGTVTVLDGATGAPVATHAVGGGPTFALADCDAVWVTNAGAGTVTALQVGGVTRVSAVGVTPMGLACDGSDLWVANSGDGTVTRLPIGMRGISGTVTSGDQALQVTGMPVQIRDLQRGRVQLVTAHAGGWFSAARLVSGTYEVKPVLPSGYQTDPPWRTVTVSALDVAGQDFTITHNDCQSLQFTCGPPGFPAAVCVDPVMGPACSPVFGAGCAPCMGTCTVNYSPTTGLNCTP